MVVDWTKHRFSGGALALDVANSVVHRRDPKRRFDRFDDRDEIARFAAAAGLHRADELGGVLLDVRDPGAAVPKVMRLREATDALFRDAARHRGMDDAALVTFLRACADTLEPDGAPVRAGMLRFETALARSALALLPQIERLRICDNCGWLFIDRSRNGSRKWCDMAVCGNRSKARRHYERMRRKETADAA